MTVTTIRSSSSTAAGTTTPAPGPEVEGPVFFPGDPGWDEEIAAFNAAVVHHPVIVIGAVCAQDVAAAVRWATERELPVAVQGTGHGATSPADGFVMISTKRMQGVSIDPQHRTARVEAGVRWGAVIEAATPYGLAPLNGSSSHVGVVGYTLGGGVGVLARKYGFAADHVVSIDLVTADGELRHVDAQSEPELFWALRGGKGNFGIVVAIEFELVPVSRMYGGGIFFPGSAAREVLHAWRQWAPTMPEDVTTSLALMRLPDLPDVPEPLRNTLSVHLRFAYLGSEVDGAALIAPMRAVAPAIMDMVGEMPYTAVDTVHMDPTDPMPVWESGALLRELPEAAVETLLAQAGPEVDVPLIMVEIRLLGGALSRQPQHPNAVAGREGGFLLFVLGPCVPGLEDVVPFVGQGVIESLSPYTTGTKLLNHLGSTTAPHEVATAWTRDTYRRLAALKAAYDPRNVFRYGHAITPEA